MLDSGAMRSLPARISGLAVLSALLQLLPFPLAGPVPELRRLVGWFCLAPRFFALFSHDESGRPLGRARSAIVGYLCGVLWFAGNCYWIYQTMYLYGGLPAPVALGILILFSLYLGLYFALFGLCFAAIRSWKGPGAALLFSPVLWVAVEMARTRLTGFPWDLLGYTQLESVWFTSLAPVTGVMGLSLLVAAGNALWLWRPGLGSRQARWIGPALAVAVMGVSYAGSRAYLPPRQATAAAVLVQDNLSVGAEAQGTHESQPELYESLFARTLHPVVDPAVLSLRLTQQLRDGYPQPSLVLWPEAPTDFNDGDARFREIMGKVAATTHAPVAVDAVGQSPSPNEHGRYDPFVSASFFLPDGTYAGRYDKMHLVPFGEYTPYKQLFFFAGHLLDQLNFVPGTRRSLFSAEGRRYGVFICYESIFGDEIREFALKGAEVLVNLSDDGWYGDTSAPWEHLDMARMRAIENRRWLLRDTNTGLTGSIDPDGRIVAQMPRHIRGAVEVPFAYRHEITTYTRWGDWVGWLCSLVIVSVLLGSWLQLRYPATARASRVD